MMLSCVAVGMTSRWSRSQLLSSSWPVLAQYIMTLATAVWPISMPASLAVDDVVGDDLLAGVLRQRKLDVERRFGGIGRRADADDVDEEAHGGVRRDDVAGALLAVGEVGRDVEAQLLADGDADEALLPALDDRRVVLAEHHGVRLALVVRLEAGAVLAEDAREVDEHRVADLSRLAGARFQLGDLELGRDLVRLCRTAAAR